MKLSRLPYDPGNLLEFFQEGLESMGAVCERSWHDRLELVAEGSAARLWNADGALMETELHFAPMGESLPRRAENEVFPGCPLTFRLAEALGLSNPELQRAILEASDIAKSPAPEVAAKLWHSQFPGSARWKLETPFAAGWHFSLLVLARCEIQAVEQHWSLHRLAVSLPDGSRDEGLAENLDYCQLRPDSSAPDAWPALDPASWRQSFQRALAEELEPEIATIRSRQQNYLGRELDRIDAYFKNYGLELTERLRRLRNENTRVKGEERLAAAKIEHERRRHDQLRRHEIRIIPHVDALLLLAEPAWKARVSCVRQGAHSLQTCDALFVPRARRWIVEMD
jgi:hypothetical protein